MEEIKVKEYVRTLEDGIYKIKNYELGNRLVCVYSDDGHVYNYPKNEFLKYKHSSNIIDLIEVRRLCE